MTDACCAPNEQNKKKIKSRNSLDVSVSQEDVGIDFSKISAGWFLMGSDSKSVFQGHSTTEIERFELNEGETGNEYARVCKEMPKKCHFSEFEMVHFT